MEYHETASAPVPTCATFFWFASLDGKEGHCYWRLRGEPPPLLKPLVHASACCARHPDICGANDVTPGAVRERNRTASRGRKPWTA